MIGLELVGFEVVDVRVVVLVEEVEVRPVVVLVFIGSSSSSVVSAGGFSTPDPLHSAFPAESLPQVAPGATQFRPKTVIDNVYLRQQKFSPGHSTWVGSTQPPKPLRGC